jgi:predicted DNA binding CopG/RHH family protein
MNAKIKYTNESIGKVEVVADMLPSPEELAFKEDTVKVTISLSKSSVDFFKKEAKKHDTKYQQMIRRLLDAYTHAQSRQITNHSTRTRKRAG